MFENSGLKSIVIPDSVKEIGHAAFSNCSKLVSVTIPISVSTIDNYAFYNCFELKVNGAVNYKGKTEDWEKITIGNTGNDELKGAKIICTDDTITP